MLGEPLVGLAPDFSKCNGRLPLAILSERPDAGLLRRATPSAWRGAQLPGGYVLTRARQTVLGRGGEGNGLVVARLRGPRRAWEGGGARRSVARRRAVCSGALEGCEGYRRPNLRALEGDAGPAVFPAFLDLGVDQQVVGALARVLATAGYPAACSGSHKAPGQGRPWPHRQPSSCGTQGGRTAEGQGARVQTVMRSTFRVLLEASGAGPRAAGAMTSERGRRSPLVTSSMERGKGSVNRSVFPRCCRQAVRTARRWLRARSSRPPGSPPCRGITSGARRDCRHACAGANVLAAAPCGTEAAAPLERRTGPCGAAWPLSALGAVDPCSPRSAGLRCGR